MRWLPLPSSILARNPANLSKLLSAPTWLFRKEVFEKVSGFRTDLGPRPGSETCSEDTEFGFRALGAGHRHWYEPSAIVYHSLPAQRLQKEYFLAWWYDKARADIRAFALPQGKAPNCRCSPLLLPTACQLDPAMDHRHQSARRFSCKLKVWMILGDIAECYRLSIRAKHQDEKCNA